MHILYLIHQFYPNYYSGTERVIFGTASYMQKLGHQVTVLTYSHEEDITYAHKMDELLYNKYMFEGINVWAIKGLSSEYNCMNLIASENPNYEFIIKKINPDMIHAGHLMNMNAFLQAGKRLNIPYVLNLTDFWLICHKAQMILDNGRLCSGPEKGQLCQLLCMGLKKEYYIERYKQACKILDESKANIVSSEFLHNMMSHAIEGFKSVKIPYGINFSYLSVNNSKYTKDSKLNFLFSGTLSKHKGIDTVVKAFKDLSNDNYTLNIYGDGPLREFVKVEAAKSDNMNYFGSYQKEETKNLINENDIVLIPSAWYENNPIILQEMIAANLPPIVSNIGSLPEMIIDGKTGFVFEMSSVKDLKRVIRKILSDPSQLNIVKSNMYKNYKVITIEQQVLAYLNIYNKIFGNVT